MSEFKSMKFWTGGDAALQQDIIALLLKQGYHLNNNLSPGLNVDCALETYGEEWNAGLVTAMTTDRTYFDDSDKKEVSIDWMRKSKPKPKPKAKRKLYLWAIQSYAGYWWIPSSLWPDKEAVQTAMGKDADEVMRLDHTMIEVD